MNTITPTPTPDKWFLHEDRMARNIVLRDISEMAAFLTRSLFIIDKHPDLRISMLTSDLSTRPSVAVIIGLKHGIVTEEAAAFAQKINDILE